MYTYYRSIACRVGWPGCCRRFHVESSGNKGLRDPKALIPGGICMERNARAGTPYELTPDSFRAGGILVCFAPFRYRVKIISISKMQRRTSRFWRATAQTRQCSATAWRRNSSQTYGPYCVVFAVEFSLDFEPLCVSAFLEPCRTTGTW